jgi:hypothetical protein
VRENMSDEYPRDAAFDAKGNPLFTDDGNLASAADAGKFPNNPLFVYGEKLYSGDVYDGSGYKVRSPGGGFSTTSGGHAGVDPAGAVGGLVAAAYIGFFIMISGPIDKWLMGVARNQTDRAHELEIDLPSIKGPNLGPILASILFWTWSFLFLSTKMAFAVTGLTFVGCIFPPCTTPLILIMLGLVIAKGNEWSWYSGKWAKVDNLKRAKKIWILLMFMAYAIIALLYMLDSTDIVDLTTPLSQAVERLSAAIERLSAATE